MSKPLRIFILVLILILSFCLRFYQLDSIPAGLHADAASQGYNAFSLLQTGKDYLGQTLPILFRTFGYYQPPLYTYLTIIPVFFWGNSQFSAHFISALSGLLLVAVTYFFILALFSERREKFVLALISALVIGVAPWAIFFSRLAVEANLGLLVFVLSLLLFLYSLKKIQLLPLACLMLGISTHAYYSERLIAIVFLPMWLFIFRSIFLKNKKWVIFALLLFVITQVPHLLILKSGAFTQRFNQVSNVNRGFNNQSKILSTGKIIINNYFIYYSPKNLFFDSDVTLGRTMPGLSVFYNWFLLPFFLGIWYLVKNRALKFAKIIGVLLIITPLPASFTGDFFYPLRALELLWILSIVISLGLFQIYLILKSRVLKIAIFGTLLLYSLFSFYISYFILFKHEKSADYGYAYMKLMDKLPAYSSKQIVIDLARDPGVGIRIAYLKDYPAKKIQEGLRPQLRTPYYSSVVNTDVIYNLDNITVKPLSFAEACKDNLLMIGDNLSIAPNQVKEHNLKLEFEIYDLSGKVSLRGYSTHPKAECTTKKSLVFN